MALMRPSPTPGCVTTQQRSAIAEPRRQAVAHVAIRRPRVVTVQVERPHLGAAGPRPVASYWRTYPVTMGHDRRRLVGTLVLGVSGLVLLAYATSRHAPFDVVVGVLAGSAVA